MNKFPVPLLRQLLGCMQDGLSIRVTAQKLWISKSSVSLLSQTALSHGGGAIEAELLQLTDTQLLETSYPPTTKAYQELDWVEVHKKLARRNATLKLLYDAYKSQVVRRAYTYTSFCRSYSEWRQANGLGVHNGNVQAIPGERMEIDFGGDNIKWIDPNCDVQRARLLIAVLPYSNLTYAEAFPNEKQQSWISGIVHALEYFGRTPRSSLWTMQRHSSNTRAGTRAKYSRRCAPCATTMTSSRGRVSPVVSSRKTESRPVYGSHSDGSLLRWCWSVPRWRAISITSTNR